jgi:hypothetical protein
MAIDDDVLRGHIRDPEYFRVSHGLFQTRLPLDYGEPEELRRLRAWLAVLPEDARFTHVTGAGLRGWLLPELPDVVPVFAATNQMDSRPRRPGLQVSRLTHDTSSELRAGLPVESGPEILLRAARDLAHLDLVALTDAARRRRDVITAEITQLMRTSRPGVVALRRAWEASTDKSDSPWETYLRLFHEAIDVPVEPQAVLTDGTRQATADLLIVGTPFVQEYDGAVHRERGQHHRDLRRERFLAGTPYVRRGYTKQDLLEGDLAMLKEIDQLLGREHDPRRLRTWRLMVAASCLSRAGRDRVANRWLGRPPGF